MFQRYLLGATQAVATSGSHRTRHNAAVIHHNHAAYPRDKAYSGNHCRTGNRLGRIFCVHQITGKIADFKKGHARIQQSRQTLPWCQLTTLIKARLALLRNGAAAAIEFIELVHQLEHLGALAQKGLGTGINL